MEDSQDPEPIASNNLENQPGPSAASSSRTQPGPMHDKVEKILKGSPDSISSPSPSVKIQIMDRKVRLKCKGKTLLGDANIFLFSKDC